jgi:hypothetical protein
VANRAFRDCNRQGDSDSDLDNNTAFDYNQTCASYDTGSVGLTINGAIIANGVRLQRTNGTETVFQSTPAEIINYTPAIYLQDYAYKSHVRSDIKTILYREVAPRF